jgi:2-C-methyl-D-erythritol 4-phosphate cytidylyltransferase
VNNNAVIVAAGKSERFGARLPKQFHKVAGRPLLAWTIAAFEKARLVDQIVVVTAEEFQDFVSTEIVDAFKFTKVNKVVNGGKNRKESVLNGLKALPLNTRIVAIQDGVRPLTNSADIDRVIDSASKFGAAMLAMPSRDTVKEVKGDTITKTLDRNKIWLAQTPQAFEFKQILEAHTKATNSADITDDSILIEKMGVRIRVLEPSSCNLKVTSPEDLAYVESVLRTKSNV